LVRHGEPEEASRGRCYGRTDYALSEKGHSQAARVAEWLAPWEPEAIYASPARRAVQTAQPLSEKLNVPIESREGFWELHFGDHEGRLFAELPLDIFDAWAHDPSSLRMPAGESFADLEARAWPILDGLRLAHQGATFVVFAHGGTNRVLLGRVLGLPPSALFRMDQSYCGASVIDWHGDRAVVRTINHVVSRNRFLKTI
jgi:broad specificity phosphatase PhoE